MKTSIGPKSWITQTGTTSLISISMLKMTDIKAALMLCLHLSSEQAQNQGFGPWFYQDFLLPKIQSWTYTWL